MTGTIDEDGIDVRRTKRLDLRRRDTSRIVRNVVTRKSNSGRLQSIVPTTNQLIATHNENWTTLAIDRSKRTGRRSELIVRPSYEMSVLDNNPYEPQLDLRNTRTNKGNLHDDQLARREKKKKKCCCCC